MKTPLLFGLLGYPLKHTLSPAMHNAAFMALGIAAEYKVFEIPPEELGAFLERLSEQHIAGLNVTVPYKERVLGYLQFDEASEYLKTLKAVNTMVNDQGVWKGYNTDVEGFLRHLREQVDPAGKKIALLGAGGAGKAVAYALARSQAAQIALFDTEHSRSLATAAMIRVSSSYDAISSVEKIAGLELAHKDILINATPVGLKDSDPCVINEELLHKGLFVYDLIYNPPETRLLAAARKAGARTSNGLGMLLYQGARAFRYFTGKEAPLEVMKNALEKSLQNRGVAL